MERNAGCVGDGLVEIPAELGQERLEVFDGDHHLRVLGAERAGDAARLLQFTRAVLLLVADRKTFHATFASLAAQVDHLRSDDAGVEAAGKEDADRHVGHQANLHRLASAAPELLCQFVVAAGVGLGRKDGVPVAAHAQLPRLVDADARWRKLEDLRKSGQARRHVAQREVEIERLFIELIRHAGIAEERLHLRTKRKPISAEMIIERLLAQAVAREQEPPARRIPDDKGEHAAQPLGQRIAPLFVAVDQHLGVALAAEEMALGDQLGAEIEVIVDFAIEGDVNGAVLVAHRLRAEGREVDDREPPMPERDRAVGEEAAAVGAAMSDHGGHPAQQLAVGGAREVAIEEAGNAAHISSPKV